MNRPFTVCRMNGVDVVLYKGHTVRVETLVHLLNLHHKKDPDQREIRKLMSKLEED